MYSEVKQSFVGVNKNEEVFWKKIMCIFFLFKSTSFIFLRLTCNHTTTIHSTTTEVLLNCYSSAWSEPLQKLVCVKIPAYILDALYTPKKISKPQLHTNSYWCPFESIDTFAFQLTYLSVQNLTVSSIDKQTKKKHRLQNLSISACWWPELHFSHAAPSWYFRKDFPFMAIYLHATLHAEGSWLWTLRGFGVDKSIVNRTERGAEKLDKKNCLRKKKQHLNTLKSILVHREGCKWLANQVGICNRG